MDKILKTIEAWQNYCAVVGELPNQIQNKLGFVTFAKEQKRIETVLQGELSLYEEAQKQEDQRLRIKDSIKRYKSERDVAATNADTAEIERLSSVINVLKDSIGGAE